MRFPVTGAALALLGISGGVEAGDTHVQTVMQQTTTDQFRTAQHIPVRRFEGDLSLERAVNLALQQNPLLLNALQEIQRTRGQIIEVRAVALPHLAATGAYEQQDRRLIRGGGGGGSTGTSSLLNSGVLTALSNSSSGTGTGNVINAAGSNTGTTTSTTTTSGTGVTSGNVSSGSSGSTGSGTNSSTAVGSNSNNSDLSSQLSTLFGGTGNSFVQNKSWNVELEVRQAIYEGGQIRAALKIAQLANDSSYYGLRDVIDTVISTTRQQFYNVLLTRALILVQEESIRLLEQQLGDQKNRFEAGTVPRFNVLQAEVALSNARPDLIRARNNYLISQVQLAKTLNLEPGANGRPTFHAVGTLTASIRKISLPDALMLARARRPFLKVQRQTILIDVQNISVEMAGYKPRIDAHAGWEFRNRSGAEDLSDVVNGWFFGLTGSWDIFDGFATYGRVKEARARLGQAKANYEDAVHQVDLEVETAYFNLQQARETIASQQKNIEEAAEAVRLASERLGAGAGTQLEVLQSQVQLTLARSTELQARADYNNALADFDRATATNTVYHDGFKDPLDKTQKGIFARIAETGLPKAEPVEAR